MSRQCDQMRRSEAAEIRAIRAAEREAKARSVLRLLDEGWALYQVASELGLSIDTVRAVRDEVRA